MILQKEIRLKPCSRGFHLITHEIISSLPELPESGLLNLFIKHTSAGLTINENADQDVQTDLAKIFDKLIPEKDSAYKHTLEGEDDMPAHAKSTLTGNSLTIPITSHQLNLGVWQGIYLCEFRNYGGSRKIVATILY